MVRVRSVSYLLLCSCLLAAAGAGCGGFGIGGGRTGAATVHNQELEEVGRVFRMYQKGRKPPPKDLNELLRFEQGYPAGIASIRSKATIVCWGAGLSDDPRAPETVLAYQKEAPESGGLVLMQDGNVQSLSAEQFAAAPKAK